MTVRIAWIRVAIDSDDEEEVGSFLTIMTAAVDKVATAVVKELHSIHIVEPIESGQSFALRDTEPADRDDI